MRTLRKIISDSKISLSLILQHLEDNLYAAMKYQIKIRYDKTRMYF